VSLPFIRIPSENAPALPYSVALFRLAKTPMGGDFSSTESWDRLVQFGQTSVNPTFLRLKFVLANAAYWVRIICNGNKKSTGTSKNLRSDYFIAPFRTRSTWLRLSDLRFCADISGGGLLPGRGLEAQPPRNS